MSGGAAEQLADMIRKAQRQAEEALLLALISAELAKAVVDRLPVKERQRIAERLTAKVASIVGKEKFEPVEQLIQAVRNPSKTKH